MGNSKSNHKTLPLVSTTKFILGIIDVQNDFCKGGELAVEEADIVIGPINKLIFMFSKIMDTFISQDYHPENHMSFDKTHQKEKYTKNKLKLKMDDGDTLEVEQMMWPTHCVKNTYGSELHKDLIVTGKEILIKKGKNSNIESYSAFGDEYKGKYEDTKLNDFLKKKFITDIILTGIATDYCVYNTALDALRYGYKVHLILSCTRGVNFETTKNALNDMKEKGVLFYKTVDDFYAYYDSLTSF